MESYNEHDRMKKYAKAFKLTKKFKTYAKTNLRPIVDIIPVLAGESGVVSHIKRPKEMYNSKYW